MSPLEDALVWLERIQAMDPVLQRDPLTGEPGPRGWLQARRVFFWVGRLRSPVSEPLQLAAMGQHLCRWQVPRASFPMDRAGYLRWRTEMKSFHASKVVEVMGRAGCPPEWGTRVTLILEKRNLAEDPEVQAFEDALCLVFLEFELEGLARRSAVETVLGALRKSWGKMSDAGRQVALELPLGADGREWLRRALEA